MNTYWLLSIGLSMSISVAVAHEGHANTTQAPAVQPLEVKGTHDAQTYFTDTLLLNQQGESVRFYSDVLKDRIVVLNVIFTHCEDACPLITRKLKEVREAMGEEAAKKVTFISLTSDPLRDTPQVLAEYARKHGADSANWIFLTGTQANMDLVLGRLGHFIESPEQHSTQLIAGDVAHKQWSKIRPDAPVPAIVQRLKLLSMPIAGR
ncbi:SCO family protein [Pseudomonas sp. NPDC078700]|uniref:SCO family protein n=1 Tax=Pseudomonas sp. NPDC078700 TaxID=3364424 RepID=UPI0037C5A77C